MEVVESLLIGDYRIIQDTESYRFTSDSVLLSRFARAKKGDVVADFCAGSGIVGLNFYALHQGVKSVTLYEIDKRLSEMSKKTVALNGLESVFTVCNLPVQEIAENEAFSLVLCNPPYERGGFASPDENKAACKKELSLSFGELCKAASRSLKFGGRFALVHRADRLSELFCTLTACNLQPKRLRLVAGKEGAKPYAALIEAVKGGKAGLDVLPVLVNEK